MAKNKRILVVEDDLEVLSMLKDYLQFVGYEVTTAEDGLKGMKALKEGQFDLVITDLTMPYVSGIGLITIIKREHPNVPVIAITGFGYYAEELAHEKKADYILSKPFEIEELRQIITHLLGE
ncbi:response regulator [Thermosulfuriphilus sp.]